MNNKTKPDYTIKTFREIAEWVFWDLDVNYNLNQNDEGNFYVNKLYINTHKMKLSYKTELYDIEVVNLKEKLQTLQKLLERE